jgi:hypothetical protein
MTDFKAGGIPIPDYDKDEINYFTEKTEFTEDVFVYGKLYAELGGDIQTFSTGNVERMRITKEGDIIFTTNNVSISGITSIATLNVNGNTNLSGITTGTFIGDGSGLTGVIGVGQGIEVQDSASVVGTAGTVNFENNLDVVSFTGGAVTVRGSQNFTGVVTATTFSGSGASLTSLPAGNLTGTVADARISTLTASKLTGALPAISAVNLTNIPAGNLTGTVDDARISTISASKLTGALPAISGANLTNLAGGLVAQARHAIDLSTSTQYNPVGYVDKLTLTVNNVQSTSKILLFFRMALGHNGSGETLGRVTGPSLFGGDTTFTTASGLGNVSTGPTHGILFDVSNSTSRTFKIQYADNGGVSSTISNCELFAVEIKVS